MRALFAAPVVSRQPPVHFGVRPVSLAIAVVLKVVFTRKCVKDLAVNLGQSAYYGATRLMHVRVVGRMVLELGQMKPTAGLLAETCVRACHTAGSGLHVQGLSREALDELSALVEDIQHKWLQLAFWLHRLARGAGGMQEHPEHEKFSPNLCPKQVAENTM